MKKLLSIVLALLMVMMPLTMTATAADDATQQIPTGTATPNTSYDLVITEICAAPENDIYEYVEVINTSDSTINLKDYFIFRFGFSHSGKYERTGYYQLFGIKSNQKLAKFTALSLADYDVTLAKGEIAILWFVSKAGKELTVDNFKTYWQNEGADEVANVKVVRVQNYTATTDENNNEVITTNYPASYINANCGDGFLPDRYAGFALSTVKATKANETVVVESTKTTGEGDSAVTETIYTPTALKDIQAPAVWTIAQQLHKAADSIALCYVRKDVDAGVSYNYFGKLNMDEWKALTVDNTIFAQNGINPTITEDEFMYPALVWGKDKVESFFDTDKAWNVATAKSGRTYVATGTRLLPSPGKLWNEQFGTDGDIPSFDAAKGATSVVRIGWTPDAE